MLISMSNRSDCGSDCEQRTNKQCPEMISLRQSDFSIDHILNRAGERNDRFLKSDGDINFDNLQQTDQPIFDWIYYTRYRPPKLPRPIKQGPIKRTAGRLPRVPFTPSQLQALEEAYTKSTYLSSDDAETIAQNLYLTSTRVKIWFQNRRARDRRERKDNNSIEQQPINFSVSSSHYFLPTSTTSASSSSSRIRNLAIDQDRRSSF